jgi:prepilin-type processing-associated H-X9-DG protein
LLFWDEREDIINWGNFFVDMTGYPHDPAQAQFGGDLPAFYHDRAGVVSFVDGHAQIKRWTDPRTMPPLNDANPPWGSASWDNADIVWMQEHATRRMP